MPPPSTATARRATARPSTPPGPSPRRPPLRLFEPAPRRRTAGRAVRPSTMWLSALLVVGSLLAVVVGDALLAAGQVRLSSVQAKVAAASAAEKSLQVAVAEKAAPPVVVGQAESQGLVAPDQVVYLPRVPLDVALPAPHTTGAAVATTGTAPPASAASAPSAGTAPATTPAAGR